MLVPFGAHTLDFPRHWVTRTDSRGEPLRVWERYGMPRIDDFYLNNVFYLYKRPEDARDPNADAFGTGFVVGFPGTLVKDYMHLYGVSNAHVVGFPTGAPVPRFNSGDGTYVRELEVTDWEPHPGGDDLAVALLNMESPESDAIDIAYVTPEHFVSHSALDARPMLGIGDDVFMIGMFLHQPGVKRNHPSVRFGHISMIPDEAERIPQMQRSGFRQLSFLLDMRSLGGYSGSPVYVYRSRHAGTGIDASLLGIHWGALRDDDGLHTGMNGVVPAWKLWELLMTKKFVDQRKDDEERIAKKRRAPRGAATLDSVKAAANPHHERDFTNLLQRAVKPPK